jgi:hypothetical protein
MDNNNDVVGSAVAVDDANNYDNTNDNGTTEQVEATDTTASTKNHFVTVASTCSVPDDCVRREDEKDDDENNQRLRSRRTSTAISRTITTGTATTGKTYLVPPRPKPITIIYPIVLTRDIMTSIPAAVPKKRWNESIPPLSCVVTTTTSSSVAVTTASVEAKSKVSDVTTNETKNTNKSKMHYNDISTITIPLYDIEQYQKEFKNGYWFRMVVSIVLSILFYGVLLLILGMIIYLLWLLLALWLRDEDKAIEKLVNNTHSANVVHQKE